MGGAQRKDLMPGDATGDATGDAGSLNCSISGFRPRDGVGMLGYLMNPDDVIWMLKMILVLQRLNKIAWMCMQIVYDHFCQTVLRVLVYLQRCVDILSSYDSYD